MNRLCTWLLALVCFLSLSGTAFAEGYSLYEYSARGIALGGATMARKPDPSAIAHNAALIARLPGVHLMGGFTTITPSGSMETRVGGVTDRSDLKPGTWVVPHFYYTHQLNDSFTIGVGEFSRFGLGFEYSHDWPGRYNIYRVALDTFSINPVIAWAVTDSLSLAAGIELVHVNLDLQKRVPVIMGGTQVAEVDSNIQDASDTNFGFNLAAHYQFNEQWAAGFQYRSKVRVHSYGDAEFSLISGNPAVMANFPNGSAHAVVTLPDSFAGGVSYSPIPELSIEVGAIYTRWSSFDNLNINFGTGLPQHNSVSTRNWRDVWRLNVGVEYEPLDWLALRVGYVFDQSPMPGNHEDYLVPTDDRHIFSLGSGFKYCDWTLDLAYGYIMPGDRKYAAKNAIGVVESETKDAKTHMFSFSLGYKF